MANFSDFFITYDHVKNYELYLKYNFKLFDKRRLGKQRVEAMQIYYCLNLTSENLNQTHSGVQLDSNSNIQNSIQNYEPIVEKKRGWINHPAVKMWKGYEEALKMYINLCIEEWIERGCKNNMKIYKVNEKVVKIPYWLYNNNLSQSHQIAMLRKEIARNEKDWYVQLWSEKKITCEPKFFDLGYYWPEKNIFSDFQDDYYEILKEEEKKFIYYTLLSV